MKQETEISTLKLGLTLLAALLLGFMFMQRYFGFLLLAFLLWFIPWAVYAAWAVRKYPQQKKKRYQLLTIWGVMVVVVLGVNYYHHVSTRNRADALVAAITSYMQANSRCPASLAEIGVSKGEQQARLGTSAYACNGQHRPYLAYVAPYSVYGQYIYDFENACWITGFSGTKRNAP